MSPLLPWFQLHSDQTSTSVLINEKSKSEAKTLPSFCCCFFSTVLSTKFHLFIVLQHHPLCSLWISELNGGKNQTQTHNNAVNSTAATAAQHGRLRNSRAARPAEVAVNYVVGAIRETPHVGYNAPLRGCGAPRTGTILQNQICGSICCKLGSNRKKLLVEL